MRNILAVMMVVVSLSLVACTPGERIVGAAVVGAITGGVIMAAVDSSHNHYSHHSHPGYYGHRPPGAYHDGRHFGGSHGMRRR